MNGPHEPQLATVLALAAAIAIGLTGCPQKEGPAVPGADAGAAVDAAGTSSSSAAEAGGANGGSEGGLAPSDATLAWTEAIRADRWTDAEAAIARLPAAEQNKPEVRYARARVALALGKHADAIARLEKLEDDLPLVRDAIAKTRAQAALVVGPFV